MSPAISTMILSAAVIVMVLVAMSYANNFLSAKMAENDYSTNKQFMLTSGLQIDDIAWTVGRTQTVRYSSNYATVKYQSAALNYTFEVANQSGIFVPVFSNVTGMIMFNMPTTFYSRGNNYFERLYPTNGSFVRQGASAPTSQVFCIEKLPMTDGSYTRVVVVPSIRVLNSTITTQQGTTNYVKFYLPTLETGNSTYLSQSATMEGRSILKIVQNNVYQVRVNVTFPNPGLGFDNSFFNFPLPLTVTLNNPVVAPNSVVEFYIGKVIVSIGNA